MSINNLLDNPNILNQIANSLPSSVSLGMKYFNTILLTNQTSGSDIEILNISLNYESGKPIYILLSVSCSASITQYCDVKLVINATDLFFPIPLGVVPTNNSCFFLYSPTTSFTGSFQVFLVPGFGANISTSASDALGIAILQSPPF